jgi:hypothetical protein
VEAVATLSKTDIKTTKNNLSGFGDKLTEFGTDINTFCVSMPAKEIVSSASSNITTILNSVKKINESDGDVLKKFGDSLATIGKNSVDKFIEAFDNSFARSSLLKAVNSLMDKAIEGAKSKDEAFITVCTDMVDSAKKKIRAKYESFKTAGKYLVTGFVNGITKNTFAAEAAATAMAEAALEAAKEALREKSPSRAFYDIGDYAGLGFVNALNDYEPISRDAAYEMADSARRGLSDAIKKVSTAINSDMDTQPTIRPVMDLSEVNTGIKAVNKLFSNGTTMGVLANVSDINARMNRRSQNGANDEVVSAINKLSKRVGSMERPSYNLNGVTYEESSDVAEAFQTIVRAAKIERRT